MYWDWDEKIQIDCILLSFSREVIIHVCDETRDAKKDFRCPQDLLLSQMGYFRDITSGNFIISMHFAFIILLCIP